MHSAAAIALFFMVLTIFSHPLSFSSTHISTTSGTLVGHIEDGVRHFLGVPYALPPTGSLRWSQPVAFNSSQTVIADRIGPSCPQLPLTNAWVYSRNGGNMTEFFPLENYSENCLTLNIWAPTSHHHRGIVANTANQSGLLPVIVWFFGGGFVQGGSNSPMFNPSSWVQHSASHIVVTVNFRCNIFGFPNAPGLAHQNLGLLDQRLALEWIRDNIKAFGGDSNRITGWGESASATALDWLSFAYPTDPILDGMILDSTTALFSDKAQISPDSTFLNFSSVAAAVGCGGNKETPSTSIKSMECMRSVSWETIEGVLASDTTLRFLPIVDEKIVFADYRERYQRGLFSKIPAIVGTNLHELNALVPQLPGVDSQESIYDAAGIKEFLCSSAAATSLLRSSAGRKTYRFRYDGDFENVSPPRYPGAYHASELPLVFGTAGRFHGPSTEYEKQVGGVMQHFWVVFANNTEHGLHEAGWSSYHDGGAMIIGGGITPAQEINVTELDHPCSHLDD